ncbi:hypothetical protein H0H87_006761 [Tephrocybe sp. NHM501043]|nr:hypothetical protein H0H87_006761 [Tephrocybe sp. NHM501043]
MLQVPLNTPTDVIRALLLRYSDTPELDTELEELLRRLTSFEVRTLYPRFGHNVIATCSYCHSFEDFALYFLPRPIISYIREMAFVGWHDVILTIRHLIFILLPLAVHYAPSILIPFISNPAPTSNVDTSALLVQIHQAMTHLLPSLHLLKYGQAAMMRVPELHTRASGWWKEEARVGAWIREDESEGSKAGARASVRGVARALGTSFDEAGEGMEEGKLRTSAKVMTKVLMIDGLKPSTHWQPHQG